MAKSKNLGVLAVFLVAILSTAVLVVPVMAAPNISGVFNANSVAPQFISITDSLSKTVSCIPDGVHNDVMTVTVKDTNAGGAGPNVANVTLSLVGSDATVYATVVSTTGVVQADNTLEVFTVNVPFQYYNPAANSPYHVTATVYDINGLSASGSLAGITYQPATGMTIDSGAALSFGTLNLGQTAPSTPSTTTFHNSANTAWNLNGWASNWTSNAGGQSISATTLSAISGTGPQNLGQPTLNGGTGVTIDAGIYQGGLNPPAEPSLSWSEQLPASGVVPFVGQYTTGITATAVAI